MNKNKEKYYKLILFDNIEQSKRLISNIIKLLDIYDNDIFDDIYIDNKNLLFNNNLCICNIIDINEPKWKTQDNFIINNNDNEIININHYRLVIYKFDDLIYYIEKNGNNKILNNIIINVINNINNCKSLYSDFKLENKDGIDSIDKLNKKISDFLLNKDDFNYNYKKFCNKYRIPLINYINDDDNEFSYNNIINLYEDLITNKILDSNKKLNNCDLNNLETEWYIDLKLSGNTIIQYPFYVGYGYNFYTAYPNTFDWDTTLPIALQSLREYGYDFYFTDDLQIVIFNELCINENNNINVELNVGINFNMLCS